MQRKEKVSGRKEGSSAALTEGARWTRLNSGNIQAGGVRRESYSVGRCGNFWRSRDAARRTAPGVRAS